MPTLSIALFLTGLAALFAFGIGVTRTGKTEPPRAMWLVCVGAACVIGAWVDVVVVEALV